MRCGTNTEKNTKLGEGLRRLAKESHGIQKKNNNSDPGVFQVKFLTSKMHFWNICHLMDIQCTPLAFIQLSNKYG